MVLMLNEDNTGEFDGESITYSLGKDKLTIKQASVTTTYNFTHQHNLLTLSGGDLESPVSFTRRGSSEISEAPSQKPLAQAKKSITTNSAKLIGRWSGNGEAIEFKKDGTCNYLGQTYPYQISADNVTLSTSQGNIPMTYTVAGNQLTLLVNGRQLIYMKDSADNVKKGITTRGSVSQELVGKWCYINVNSTNSGSSSSSTCLTLNADGTYEYFGESSRSVNTADVNGGTASQQSDRGTWSAEGDRIYYNSPTRGQGSYQFQKRNHPKNGDPMIVIHGSAFVTFYNKPPWN